MIHPSGILTLSEAALLKRWGSRRTLSSYVAKGLLPARPIGWGTYVTVAALEAIQKPKRGPRTPPTR